jgi:gluconokinase
VVIIVMGIVGAGKTTVGQLLAQELGWHFADADDFHPAANVEKIRNGIALTDADRAPWLAALRGAIIQWSALRENFVLACSALKRAYRDELRAAPVIFVYLKASPELVLGRLRARHGHFATESILSTQLEDLEEPEDAITVPIDHSPDAIVAEIIAQVKGKQVAYPDATKK